MFAVSRLAPICRITTASLLLAWSVASVQAQDSQDAKSDTQATALYADAANFQTNGAFDLAIKNWQEFLQKYPQHELSPKAAHYLGVCYMQTDPPAWTKAAKCFQKALQSTKHELREESLSNRGWCLYAAATADQKTDRNLLQESLQTYRELLKEFPKSSYRDRAYFYAGEAAFALGDSKGAIASYNKLLQLDGIEKSPFHCDALYARGYAQEELEQLQEAAKSYEQLLQGCVGTDLVVDVQLRLGDLSLREKKFEQAMQWFQRVLDDQAELATEDDRALALFRQGFCLARLNRPEEAAQRYEQLVEKFQDSQYTGAATLAAAQTRYQSGDMAAATKGFRKLLDGNNPVSATEAAHWLARLELSKAAAATANSAEAKAAAEAAYQIASARIAAGAEGEYAVALQLDAAEALSFQQDKLAAAMAAFEAIAKKYPKSNLAPRAIYNAAFTALQLGDHQRAIGLAGSFAQQFPSDPLKADVAFIDAEAKLLAGDAAGAAKQYLKLIAEPEYRDNEQRTQWILRGATAIQAAGQPAEAAKLIDAEMGSIQSPSERAEALLLAGQAQLQAGDASKATQSLKASREADPQGARSQEAALLEGQAKIQAGDQAAATAIWQKLVSSSPESKVADQARYKLAQLASAKGDFAEAIAQFKPIIASGRDPELLPFSLYATGWAQMSAGDYQAADKTLAKVIEQFPEHAIFDDALLAHGMTLRHLQQYDASAIDLIRFLKTKPTGILQGHGLYELALVRQKQNQPERAAKLLAELVAQVPEYPGMDKVIYELGWSLKQVGREDEAIQQFQTLIAKYPKSSLVCEAAYFVGQQQYSDEQWTEAAESFEIAANCVADDEQASHELLEKALYRLGWSYFKAADYPAAEAAFVRQYRDAGQGPLSLDAMMMVGESRFKQNKFETALRAYSKARDQIEADNDSAQTIRDDAERQVRELTLLHGGQSAAQLKDWDAAIDWYDQLRKRFPATEFLPQVFYETGFAYQQLGKEDQALRLYTQVADNYRNELAARARFMMGEIHFANKSYSLAIPEFQRVMYGFGAEQAPKEIQNWQAKSGFEAGRCAESLFDVAQTEAAKSKARSFAVKFYEYVVDKHPAHELAAQSTARLSVLSKNR